MRKSGLKIVFSLLCMCIALESVAAQNKVSDSAGTRTKKVVVKKTVAKPAVSKRKFAAKKSSRKSARVVVHTGGTKIVKHVKIVNGKRQVVYTQAKTRPVMRATVPIVRTATGLVGLDGVHDSLALKSNVALIMDQSSSEVLFEKNSNISLPIASITKLMTGLVVVETKQDNDEVLEITTDDIDREKNTSSRLAIGTHLPRASLLHLALMSSENRAASALGRNYPGGLKAFVAAMNAKAKALGMRDSHFVDSSGLSSRNVASAHDLVKLVAAVQKYPILGHYSTEPESVVDANGRTLQYRNTNQLVRNPAWEIGLQKTGYISEAGRCLVMQTIIEGRSIVMIFLDSKGKLSRIADASRARKWIESIRPHAILSATFADENG